MRTDSAPEPAAEPLEARLEQFMMRNFPQIAMHGGSAAIDGTDEETGEVWISLGGACSGCGISPMTVQALKTRMVAEFEEVEVVHADAGVDPVGAPDADLDDVPF